VLENEDIADRDGYTVEANVSRLGASRQDHHGTGSGRGEPGADWGSGSCVNGPAVHRATGRFGILMTAERRYRRRLRRVDGVMPLELPDGRCECSDGGRGPWRPCEGCRETCWWAADDGEGQYWPDAAEWRKVDQSSSAAPNNRRVCDDRSIRMCQFGTRVADSGAPGIVDPCGGATGLGAYGCE
jgi:hypothetical protein